MKQNEKDIKQLANLNVDKYVRKASGAAEENVKIKIVIPLLNLLGYSTEKDMDFEHHVQNKKAQIEYPETPDWQLIYNRRTSVERVFSRLKGYRKLNYIRVRGIRKVLIHCLMALIVFQAQALATGKGGLVRKVA